MVHELKTWPEYFWAVKRGLKKFEIRKDDRDYNLYDFLELKEFDPDKQEYTGESITVGVTYLLREQPFVPEGYVCMSIDTDPLPF